MADQVIIICGEELAKYGFPGDHPFGQDRHDVFMTELARSPYAAQTVQRPSRPATRNEIERFHTAAYVDRVREFSELGLWLSGRRRYACVPGNLRGGGTHRRRNARCVDGHHGGRHSPRLHPDQRTPPRRAGTRAAGFCVFSDVGVAIETAMDMYGLDRVAYVDIDAPPRRRRVLRIRDRAQSPVRRHPRGRPVSSTPEPVPAARRDADRPKAPS